MINFIIAFSFFFTFCQFSKNKSLTDPVLKYAGTDRAYDFPIHSEWLNTKRELKLNDLKGKIVLLHFWKYSSINCIHSIETLKKLNLKWKNELVIIGVHSPKFQAERKIENLKEAVSRFEIEYPIINDLNLTLWQKYQINSWPSFVFIDPNGNFTGAQSGEGVYEDYNTLISNMVSEFANYKILSNKPISILNKNQVGKNTHSPLLYPGKLILNETGTELFVSDSKHNRILHIEIKSGKVIDIIGDGKIGFKDGKFETANLNNPQGLSLFEDNLYIADSGNHSIRLANLITKKLKTIAGTGKQARSYNVPGIGKNVAYVSPWDILINKNILYITMKGTHQIWTLNTLNFESDVFAGSGSENLFDGTLQETALAQPSGITGNGFKLFFLDSETSAVRSLDLFYSKKVKTIIGKGLNEFGDIDEHYPFARLQYPTGICFANGKLYIADTFNNKIKGIDPNTNELTTIAGNGDSGNLNGSLIESKFFEPSGIAVFKNLIYVADTNNHSIRILNLNANLVTNFEFQLDKN